MPVVLRSLNRPEARGFAKAFWKNTRYAERMSPSGLFLSSGRVYEAEGRRMDRVAVRIVKGLVFHETHKRVPDDHKVQPIHLSQVSRLPSPYRETTEEFIQALLQEEPEQIGEAFAFSRLWSPKGWPRSVWLFGFYGGIEYFAYVGPIDVNEAV